MIFRPVDFFIALVVLLLLAPNLSKLPSCCGIQEAVFFFERVEICMGGNARFVGIEAMLLLLPSHLVDS